MHFEVTAIQRWDVFDMQRTCLYDHDCINEQLICIDMCTVVLLSVKYSMGSLQASMTYLRHAGVTEWFWKASLHRRYIQRKEFCRLSTWKLGTKAALRSLHIAPVELNWTGSVYLPLLLISSQIGKGSIFYQKWNNKMDLRQWNYKCHLVNYYILSIIKDLYWFLIKCNVLVNSYRIIVTIIVTFFACKQMSSIYESRQQFV